MSSLQTRPLFSGARLAYKENKGELGITQALDVGSIRSVKVGRLYCFT